MTWTESIQQLKATGELEISQLQQRIQELEASLAERQTQLDNLEGEVETQKKTIDDLTNQKSKAEDETQQCRVELELTVKGKAAIEQELIQMHQFIEQSESKRSSLEETLRILKKNIEESTLARRKLEEHLKKKDGEFQELEERSRTLQKELKTKEATDVELTNQAQVEVNVMQHKLEELTTVKKRTETEIITLKSEMNSVLVHKQVAEEKAQRFKELLDDSNNRLKKLQMDTESERSSMRQKSEELGQEMSEMKKSIYLLQEQIKSLQWDKSSLEQKAIFYRTEVEGLKEQLKINQGKLVQRSSVEQEVSQRMCCLQEELSSKQAEVDQMKFQSKELTRVNVLLGNDIRALQVNIDSLTQDKTFSEQKVKSLKIEIESWKQQLQTVRDEFTLKIKSEQDSQLKCKNLEAEIQKSGLIVSQLQKQIEDLNKINIEMERKMILMTAQLDKVTVEIGSKDQQINIFKSQVEGTKSQVRIIEEELQKKSQTSHELQLKLRDYNDEVKKTYELQQKNKTLNLNIANYEKEIRNLTSELASVCTQKNLANQKVQEQKAEINDLNTTLKKTIAELQKESAEGQRYVNKLTALEDDLLRCKQNIKGVTGSSEKMVADLKQEVNTLQRDKKTADQKLGKFKVELEESNFALKRAKDELVKEAQERKIKQSKIMELEAELQKHKLTVKDITSSSEKSSMNFKQEITVLGRERVETQDKILSLRSEVTTLKRQRDQAQEDAQKKLKESSVLQQRSQQLEDQLENCKQMLEDLKSKLELQKTGYERQLSLVQTEMERKLILQQSEIKLEIEKKSKEHSYSHVESAEMDKMFLKQEIERLKTLSQNTLKSKQEADQQLHDLHIKMDQLKQERTTLSQDLLRAKSEIAQLEAIKVKLNSNICHLENRHSESSKEAIQLRQQLAESGQKLKVKEKEARSLNEQIVAYVKEVKGLQEKVLKLEVMIKSENRKKKEVEALSETSHQYARGNNVSNMKTEFLVTRKIVSYESQHNLEEELVKMEEPSEE